MLDITRIHQFLRAQFDREAEAGFPRLGRVPSMYVRHFVDYYRVLDTASQSALADGSTLWGSHTLGGTTIRENEFAGFDVGAALESNVARRQWRDELAQGNSRDPHRYYTVPDLRAYRGLATMRRKAGQTPPTEWDRMMDEYASSVAGAKAPALRKLVRELIQQRFRGRATRGSGGTWTYEGDANGSSVFMSVDWGGSYAQLRYNLIVETAAGKLVLSRGFEGALGAGLGDWDFLTEENAAESVALLGDLIDDTALWAERLFDPKTASA